MKGIIIQSLVPMRSAFTDKSEMISQLLFGEQLEILQEMEKWVKVKNLTDNYTGWVDKKMIHITNIAGKEPKTNILPIPLLPIINTHSGEKMFLPAGSRISDNENGRLQFLNQPFEYEPHVFDFVDQVTPNELTRIALQFLNAPYLWGGKSILGIDCSGLTQLVYAICHISLPRDSYQQAEHGKKIDLLTDSLPGDLAFFSNEKNEIIHVGILLNPAEIIHAYGFVRIDNINQLGIISSQGIVTHKLHDIRRLL